MNLRDIVERRLPWLVWIAALLLYIGTSAPSIVEFFDDSLEFQLVGPTLGITHPTGYPLYTLLSGLWSRVLFPVGNWAWRMNIFSALAASGTILFVFLLARHLTTDSTERAVTAQTAKHPSVQSNWCGLAAAITFALSPVWWAQATIAEVYALHNLFVVTILYAAIRPSPPLNHDQQPLHPCTLAPFHLFTLPLLTSLSLTHHRTTVLLLPGLVIYLLWTVPPLRRPSRVWWRCGLALVAPLLLYLYIPVRAAMGVMDLNGSYQNTPRGFWAHVVVPAYTSFLQDNPLAVTRDFSDWLMLFQAQFGWLGIGLSALGLVSLVGFQGRQRPAWWLILLVLLPNLLFALSYRVPDVAVFLLPVFLCMALFVGGGVYTIYALLARIDKARSFVPISAGMLIVAGLAAGPILRDTLINRSQDWARHDQAVAMAKVDFPSDSRVVALEGEATALKYMQQAAGLGLNAQAIFARDGGEAARRALVTKFVTEGIPVYLTRELPGIETHYSFSAAGPLVHVWPRGKAVVAPPQHLLDEAMVDGALQLVGYDLDVLNEAGGPTLRLGLYWRPRLQLTQRLKVSLRLLDGDGNAMPWADGVPNYDRFPLRQVAYTDQWVPGELIRDVQYARLPTGLVVPPAAVQVIMYDAETIQEMGRWQTVLPPYE